MSYIRCLKTNGIFYTTILLYTGEVPLIRISKKDWWSPCCFRDMGVLYLEETIFGTRPLLLTLNFFLDWEMTK